MVIRKEIVSSFVLILFGIGFLVYGTRYPLDDWANPGPAVFPLLVGSALVILSVWQLTHSFRKPKHPGDGLNAKSLRVFFKTNRGETKALIMIAVFVVYLVTVSWVGFFVSNFVFVVISSRLVEARDWKGPVSLSLGVNLFCYFLFEVWLKVSFPRGLLF